jgi:uracil-DNA glycosylase family 4
MRESFKDATSRHSANKSSQTTSFSEDLYSGLNLGDENTPAPKEQPEQTEKESVVKSFSEFVKEELKESQVDKIVMGGVEIQSTEASNKASHQLSVQLSATELVEKMKELEGDSGRFEGLIAGTPIKVMFVTKSLVTAEQELELSFNQLRYCFEGSAAMLFEKMIAAMKLNPQDVYISATQSVDEEDRFDLLKNEIQIIQPNLIISLGAVATNKLIDKKERLSRVHGQFYEFMIEEKTHTLMPLFHPEYLLINPNMKKLAWEDMQQAMLKF